MENNYNEFDRKTTKSLAVVFIVTALLNAGASLYFLYLSPHVSGMFGDMLNIILTFTLILVMAILATIIVVIIKKIHTTSKKLSIIDDANKRHPTSIIITTILFALSYVFALFATGIGVKIIFLLLIAFVHAFVYTFIKSVLFLRESYRAKRAASDRILPWVMIWTNILTIFLILALAFIHSALVLFL